MRGDIRQAIDGKYRIEKRKPWHGIGWTYRIAWEESWYDIELDFRVTRIFTKRGFESPQGAVEWIARATGKAKARDQRRKWWPVTAGVVPK